MVWANGSLDCNAHTHTRTGHVRYSVGVIDGSITLVKRANTRTGASLTTTTRTNLSVLATSLGAGATCCAFYCQERFSLENCWERLSAWEKFCCQERSSASGSYWAILTAFDEGVPWCASCVHAQRIRKHAHSTSSLHSSVVARK